MASLPTHFDRPVHIAVIGGTGLAKIDGYEPVALLDIDTPWGKPSAPLQIVEHAGVPIAFLARHGLHHQLAPHEVPARANMAALRHIGVRCVIAFSAVGSLQEHIRPMDFVVPDQIIDRTKGVRPFTFFEGGLVGHVGFADPFDAGLAAVVRQCAHALGGDAPASEKAAETEAAAKEESQTPTGSKTLHHGGTLICMEGPQFSTRAESNLYRSWGGSVINMSVLPEAKLAREAELAYQMICMATDYDCWRVGQADHEDVGVSMVLQYMQANSKNAKNLVGAVLDRLAHEDHSDLVRARHLEGSAVQAVQFMTKPEGRDPEAVKRISYLFPDFFKP